MGYKNLTLDGKIFTGNFTEQSDLHYLYKQTNKQTNKCVCVCIHAQSEVILCSSVISSCFSACGASTHTPLLYLGL